ncbi:MAG TPA: DUF4430 domain-containing protein [Solirubrobacteraceae bacterium]|jgi:hypothetical protein|nr:DUF4430 domain-containing protein [Solirubrobacteraceae bacterium]
MFTSRRISLAVCIASVGFASFSSAALATGPATVTVRVEGAAATVLAPTQVTTSQAPVVKEGHSCSGTSAAGALQLATSGNWSGKFYEEGGFFVETIEGDSYVNSPDGYWTFWLDNKPATKGICQTELEPGDSVLFFPECFGECPAPPNPLGIEAPPVAEVGKPVTVAVASYANATGARSPAVGAEVSYEGTSAKTDSSGNATLSFAKAGSVLVGVSEAQSVRTETTICVHAEDDGGCGTQLVSSPTAGSSGTSSAGGSAPPASPYKGSYALVASVKGVLSGHVYRRGTAPRVLAGTVLAHTAVTAVSLRLRREYRGRCSAFDGATERFRRARCGSGAFFNVSGNGVFSYQLPAALAPGRYVLDIEASDAAGNRTTLARGSSRIVFYVR